MRIRLGKGLVGRQIGSRSSFEALPERSIDHAWKMVPGGDGWVFSLGLVNEMEPYLEGRPMSGYNSAGVPDRRGAPVLRLPGFWPCYVCIQIRVDADGKLLKTNLSASTLRIVASRTTVSDDERVGLHAIAVVRLIDGVPIEHQIAKHDYQHSTSRDAGGKLRHHWGIA